MDYNSVSRGTNEPFLKGTKKIRRFCLQKHCKKPQKTKFWIKHIKIRGMIEKIKIFQLI